MEETEAQEAIKLCTITQLLKVKQGFEPRQFTPESKFLTTLLGSFYSLPRPARRPCNGDNNNGYQLLSTNKCAKHLLSALLHYS